MKQIVIKILNYFSYILFFYVIFQVFQTDNSTILNKVFSNIKNLLIGLTFLVIGNSLTGVTWSIFVNKFYNIDLKLSFIEWLNSYKAKYIPGKITSPIIRIQHNNFDNMRKELYFAIFIEQVYQVLCNFLIGSYLIFWDIYRFEYHIIFYFLINIFLYFARNINYKDFNLKYFTYVIFIQFGAIFNLAGLYFASKVFVFENEFKIALLYLLVHSISVVLSIAPAGIGVREYGLIELSKTFKIYFESIDFVALAFRIYSILGDVIIISISIITNIYIREKS